MTLPSELVDAFVQRKAAIFVGAGASRASGLPDWRGLMEPLKSDIEGCPDDLSPLEIAQYFVNENGERLLAERLSREINKSGILPSDIHKFLVRLPTDRIYTTNFDEFLELAYEKQTGYKAQKIANAAKLAIAKPDRLNIIKLHGDFEDPQTIVITAEDFEDYFASRPVLAQEVASDFLQRTVLFVGYSFSDPDVRTIMRRIRRDTKEYARNHYILQVKPTKPVVKELERRGLKVIELDGQPNQTESLVAWLKNLEHRITQEMPKPSEPVKEATHNLPRLTPDLVGRKQDISDIKTAIEKDRIVVIIGSTGVGKSSVALTIAHECAQRTPPLDFQYVVWVTAREKPEQQCWLNDVLNTVGITLEFPRIAQSPPSQLDKKKTEVTFLLQNRRTLIILDNFETMRDPALIQWLKSVPQPSRVLITSRVQTGDALPGVGIHLLEGLHPTDALVLLNRYAHEFEAQEILRGGEAALRSLVDAVCGNPQAIRLTLGMIQGGRQPLDSVVASLGALNTNIDEVFSQLFTWSWERLTSAAEQLLQVTALFPGMASMGREALEISTGLSHDDFEKALQQVFRFGLLTSTSDNRYIIHSRTRTFALEKLVSRPKFADEARERCANYYLGSVRERIWRT